MAISNYAVNMTYFTWNKDQFDSLCATYIFSLIFSTAFLKKDKNLVRC